ncbi:MAG: biotin carboxylase N-terminal domain-containing protein [Pseudomonadota bacterium]
MFDGVLIANRGEIACRIIRTARAMGLRAVAVYSEADAGALHVELADHAVPIGGAAPSESYLNGAAIIAAAKASGAGAVHPGYGFLSENPEFVADCAAAGLVFVGPSADAVRAMGLKDAAKALMEQAGVPVVPGYHGADQSDARLARAADDVGYPVLIKAVAGGGGKGMRRVMNPDAFAAALAGARAEAQAAFGNGDVLIEKWIDTPRHIEVQIFGDGAKAVHLFERDCSLQRRHQKVIEEAPAPGMTDEMRLAMTGAAVRAAEAIGYRSAGTVEFIADARDGLRPDRYYFMEMNTRLQVEHPVTEAVTGVDLVEWQLRLARGEAIPLAQDQIRLSGHAVEARLYAEDVPAGFLPATGRLSHVAFPAGLRADTGVRTGDVITPHYDPMIAKLIAAGPDRKAAVASLQRGLARTEVAGCATNHTFLRRLLRVPDFAEEMLDTGLIDRHLKDLAPPPVPCTRSRSLAALSAMGLDRAPPAHAGFALWSPIAQSVVLGLGAGTISVAVTTLAPDRFLTEVDGALHELHRIGDDWVVDGAPTGARMHRCGDAVTVFWGNAYEFSVIDPLDRTAEDAASDASVRAPMPGRVTQVFVAEGAEVAEGTPLATIEAMKMEHTLTARTPGTVAKVMVGAGSQVEAGAPVIVMAEAVE